MSDLSLNATSTAAVPIAQIEQAINAWRNLNADPSNTGDMLVLCREARMLADVYGYLIYAGETAYPVERLTVEQREALAILDRFG